MTGFPKKGTRLLSFVLSMMLLMTMALPVLAADTNTIESSNQTYTSAVRYGPSSGYLVIGHLENGTTVTVLYATKHYYKIDCYNMYGYILQTQVAQREDGTYYVNCNPASGDTSVLTYTDYADAITTRHALVALAEEQLGDPYVYGRAKPGGFDCSGLTSYLYKEQGIAINRRASTQLENGIIVSQEGLMPGDLVFFDEFPGDNYEASHVGIYVGDGQIIHSGSRGVGYARLDGHWFRDYYIGARRVLNTGNTQLQESITANLFSDELPIRTASGRTIR